MSKNKPSSAGKPADDSFERLGFQDDEKLAKFLGLQAQKDVQRKFDIVFPQQAKPKFEMAPEAANAPTGDELDLGADLDLSGDDDLVGVDMGDSNELDLGGDGGELSLGDDIPESLPSDEGLDLSMAGDLDLGDDDFSGGSLDEAEGTSLKLGDDMNLEGSVLAKLAQIDEIMEADATSATMVRTDLGSDDSADLSSDLDLGDDEFLSSQLDESSNTLTGASDFMGGEASKVSTVNEDVGFELGADEDLFEMKEEPSIKQTKTNKKVLPAAPALEVDQDEDLAFDMGSDAPAVPAARAKVQAPIEDDDVVTAATSAKSSYSQRSAEERSGFEDVKGHYNHELERLQATLNHLRTDRSELLKKIEALEEDKMIHGRHVLGMRAELDEKKIEVQLLKRRMTEEGMDLKYQLELELERRKLSEERAKAYQAEVATMQQKVKMEVKKVLSREKELEQKLELLKSDADTQIRHRDQKILELKRRIDAMEFDMDAMNAIEQKTVGDKHELEGKLDKAIKTLRTAIGILETDDPKLATLEKLKKNLEV